MRGTDAQGQPYRLIVDPTLREPPPDYYFDLNRRTGLHAADITHCYVTHEHMDHQAALAYFPGATWYAAAPVAEKLRGSEYIDGSRVVAVAGRVPAWAAMPCLCPATPSPCTGWPFSARACAWSSPATR